MKRTYEFVFRGQPNAAPLLLQADSRRDAKRQLRNRGVHDDEFIDNVTEVTQPQNNTLHEVHH